MMRNAFRSILGIVCAAVLVLSMAACGGQPKEDEAVNTLEPSETPRDETASAADGRIDVTATGTNVATYHGPKYIVSDVTVDQGAGSEVASEGFGLQEVCVIHQPESWSYIGSIGWNRNSITYTQVSMPWGSASYVYEYINEAGAAHGVEEWTRTSEQGYFSEALDIQHLEVDGMTVAYVYDDASGADLSMGIEDLESMAQSGEESQADAMRTVTMRAYVQRADDCAFTASVSCVVLDNDAFSLGPEDLVRDVLAPLTFQGKDEEIDAASFMSDLVVTNADGSGELVIAQKGDSLVSYTEHSVLMISDGPSEAMYTTLYDFAQGDSAPEDAEELGVDGRTAYAVVSEDSYDLGDETVMERRLHAWVDVDGSTVYVDAVMDDSEDALAALERVATGRFVTA